MGKMEESVLRSLDGEDINLYPHLPYILQDLWEIGSSPQPIIELIRRHRRNYTKLSLVDLGCGKGAVSIQLAHQLGCRCLGIDAVKAFIDVAREKAKEYQVDRLCRFETDDIQARLATLQGFDLIILGSIGPVLGNYESTLLKLSHSLKPGGDIIIDDGYINDVNDFNAPQLQKRAQILQQITNAGMALRDEIIQPAKDLEKMDRYMFDKLQQRCLELVQQFPEKKEIFHNYIDNQRKENTIIEEKMVCSTMLIRQLN